VGIVQHGSGQWAVALSKRQTANSLEAAAVPDRGSANYVRLFAVYCLLLTVCCLLPRAQNKRREWDQIIHASRSL